MKNGWLQSWVMTLLGFAFQAHANLDGEHPTLQVCGDAIDWPPYTYIDGDVVKGRDIDILDELLSELGYGFDITMTSWSRCLKGTKDGDYQIAVSASYSEERAQDYLYTTWYYDITPYYLYSTKRFPNGLDITSVYDLEPYIVCGIHGYNYSDFKLDNVNQFSISVFEAVTELHSLNCDVFISWHEILEGMNNVWGINYVQDDIVAMPIPDMEKHKFYMLISKHFPDAVALQEALSRAMIRYQ